MAGTVRGGDDSGWLWAVVVNDDGDGGRVVDSGGKLVWGRCDGVV